MRFYGKKILLTLFLLALLGGSFSYVRAQSCNNTEECTNLINQYSSEITKLQGQANTLKNQIAQFDAQIKLTTLKIDQTQNQIDLLSGRIDQLEVSLNDLTKAFSSRAVETYKLSKFENSFFFILGATDVKDAAQRFHYLRKIEEEDRNLLRKLETAQTTYQGEKTDQETLQKQLASQKANLNSQKAAKNSLLIVTKNDEAKYQQLLSQAKSQLDRFRRYTTSQGGSSILTNQTKCDGWGCYYNQRDSEWGNMFLGGTNYLMKDSGCFITSVAMMASHSGRAIKPNDIAQLSAAVTSGGDLKWAFDVNGIHVSITSAGAGSLDSELNAGRSVIVGLSDDPKNAPYHFIVILRKEGDKYIMNDPFMENGNGKPLTDKYNVSDITTLRLISFY